MTYPKSVKLPYRFTQFAQETGDETFPGSQMDASLFEVQRAHDDLLSFVKGVVRADGSLQNQSVGRDQLKYALSLGFEPPQAWEVGKTFTPPDTVYQGDGIYICAQRHLSVSFEDDLAANKWGVLIDFATVAADAVSARDAAREARDLASAAVSELQPHLGVVAGVADELGPVAEAAEGVTLLAQHIDEIQQVGGLADPLQIVAGVAEDVSAVGAVAAQVETVAAEIGDVQAVAALAAHIPSAAGHAAAAEDARAAAAAAAQLAEEAKTAAVKAAADAQVGLADGAVTREKLAQGVQDELASKADAATTTSALQQVEADVQTALETKADKTEVEKKLGADYAKWLEFGLRPLDDVTELITESGPWSPKHNGRARISLVGGGGGGGGGGSYRRTTGGQAGGTAVLLDVPLTKDMSFDLTLGTGGGNRNGNGVAGNNSTLTNHRVNLVAQGGVGGTKANSYVQIIPTRQSGKGHATGGDLNLHGGLGGSITTTMSGFCRSGGGSCGGFNYEQNGTNDGYSGGLIDTGSSPSHYVDSGGGGVAGAGYTPHGGGGSFGSNGGPSNNILENRVFYPKTFHSGTGAGGNGSGGRGQLAAGGGSVGSGGLGGGGGGLGGLGGPGFLLVEYLSIEEAE
ncbi:hypothetical protein [Polycladidibacter hongkongensis]|uniref:hypothetical protein n=1 Tax=Polycladidibacter hongkongensis TaxID=1647556 RepID=UPI00083310ED|nr:hypothetical protein [Pseudovibrio hongkongensis]